MVPALVLILKIKLRKKWSQCLPGQSWCFEWVSDQGIYNRIQPIWELVHDQKDEVNTRRCRSCSTWLKEDEKGSSDYNVDCCWKGKSSRENKLQEDILGRIEDEDDSTTHFNVSLEPRKGM
jgi:hypothetical protein